MKEYIGRLSCFALRQSLQNYSSADLRADLFAGLVVALVAIPLGMALAIASGVAPQNGLYTIMIAGTLVALIGGSRFQVTGPTAAFVVILAPIVHDHGLSGLLLAGWIAGLFLIIMGLAKVGDYIRFIPYPVTTGFTSGIALVIATLQIKDFFGLKLSENPQSFADRILVYWQSAPSFQPIELLVGTTTLALLILWPRITKKIPSPLATLTIMTLACFLIHQYFPQFDPATIRSRFSFDIFGHSGLGIPNTLPQLQWPWQEGISLETLRSLLGPAFAIAMLGAIESLLSAVVADGMTGTQHDSNSELFALGIANFIGPFFAAIPATGAIARTATNIRFGAKSPLAAVFHGLFTIVIVLSFAPYVSYLPMASLAALLLLVAYNMSELRHFAHILKAAPRSDVAVLLICFGLTVIFDMVVGVVAGTVLASLLFMRRMADIGSVKSLQTQTSTPDNCLTYKIEGPLFFGAAQTSMRAITSTNPGVKKIVIDMSAVPVMDITGLVALESAIRTLQLKNIEVSIAGVNSETMQILQKSSITNVRFLQ